MTFISAQPGTTSDPIAVTGLVAGDALICIDIRPVENVLIGLGYNTGNGRAHVYSINAVNGAATVINPNTLTIGAGLSSVRMEFNPTTNEIRLIANGNWRIMAGGTGALVQDDPLIGSFISPLRTTAHSRNNAGGGTNGATTHYAIDAGGSLVTVGTVDYFPGGGGDSPNSGRMHFLMAISGLPSTAITGFDIFSLSGTAANFPGDAYVTTNNMFYFLNLNTGVATQQGTIGSGLNIRDIAAGVPSTPPTPTATNTATATNTPTNTVTPTFTPTTTPTPADTPSVSGVITYGNAVGVPTPPHVSSVTVSATGPSNVFTSTVFPNGNYSLSGFLSGTYVVTPTKTGGVNGITSFDAARIAQHVAGVNILTGTQFTVADVSGNGTLSSFDAGQVARYVAGVSGSGLTASWIFSPTNRIYSDIATSITGQDYSALLMGEVSGNWTNTGARPLDGRHE